MALPFIVIPGMTILILQKHVLIITHTQIINRGRELICTRESAINISMDGSGWEVDGCDDHLNDANNTPLIFMAPRAIGNYTNTHFCHFCCRSNPYRTANRFINKSTPPPHGQGIYWVHCLITETRELDHRLSMNSVCLYKRNFRANLPIFIKKSSISWNSSTRLALLFYSCRL